MVSSFFIIQLAYDTRLERSLLTCDWVFEHVLFVEISELDHEVGRIFLPNERTKKGGHMLVSWLNVLLVAFHGDFVQKMDEKIGAKLDSAINEFQYVDAIVLLFE